MTISGKAQIAGVFGWPIGHSRSPLIHNFWLDQLGIDGAYVPLAVAPDDFEQAVRALPALGFRGANVTIPHKQAALRIVDHLDPLAREVGAVNTLVVEEDGTITGSNTDVFGFAENLQVGGAVPMGGTAVVLGAGGAARAICVALREIGLAKLTVVNRTLAHAETLANTFARDSFSMAACAWEDLEKPLSEADVIVNTTSLGMAGAPPLEIDLAPAKSSALVNDIVYTPLQTPLLKAARARGLTTVDGLGMLLHQARPGFAAWFGQAPEVTDELRALVLKDLGS